jgi:hypothetical protein
MLYSPFSVLEQEVYGKLLPPNDVTNFNMVAQGDQASLSWDPVVDLDVINGGNYWIRHTSKTSGVTWASSTNVIKSIPGTSTSTLVPLMSGSYLIKALDSSGNESLNAGYIISNVAEILSLNVLHTSNQHPSFGSGTADKGVNDSRNSNIFFDSSDNTIELSADNLSTGTHDAYYATGTHEDDVISSGTHDEYITSGTHDSFGTGTHDDARATGTHNAILNAGSTEYQAANFVDAASGNFDARSGSFDDVIHVTNKLEDDNASFDSTWLNNIIRNTTDNTTATVSSVDSGTRITLSSDLFDGYTGDTYRLETKTTQLRDTSASFVSADVGRTVRNNTDGGTATISTVDSSNLVTLSTSLFQNDHGDTWELEAGPNVLRDTGASFTSALVGRTVRNTNDSTTATVSSFTSSTELVLSSGIFDNKDTHSYDIEAGSSKLYDNTGSFTSSMVGNIVKNSTRSTDTTVSSYISANELTLASGIFDNKEGDSYTVNNELNRLRDTGATFTTALVGRTVRNTNDATTTTVSAFVNSNELTLSSGIFDNKDGHVYEMEPGYDRLYDPTASFTDEYIGKIVRNTTDNTTATISSRVDGTELVLSSGIFDNQDGEGYRIEVPNNIMRNTGATFVAGTHDNRIIRNLDTALVTTISSINSYNDLVLEDDIFGQTDGANYKVEGDIPETGYYYFTDQVFDLGASYTSRVTASLSSTGVSVMNLFDISTGLFDSNSGLFDGTDISDTNTTLEIRFTQDDPAATPTWVGWTPFFVGDYFARAMEFRAKLTSSNTSHNVQVDSLTVTIDMPDIIKRNTGVTTSYGTNNGTEVVTYATPYKIIPTLGITLQDANTGDYYTISSNTASGFTVTFYNSSSVATQKTFNWISSGY